MLNFKDVDCLFYVFLPVLGKHSLLRIKWGFQC